MKHHQEPPLPPIPLLVRYVASSFTEEVAGNQPKHSEHQPTHSHIHSHINLPPSYSSLFHHLLILIYFSFISLTYSVYLRFVLLFTHLHIHFLSENRNSTHLSYAILLRKLNNDVAYGF